jgi:hypothetical protein
VKIKEPLAYGKKWRGRSRAISAATCCSVFWMGPIRLWSERVLAAIGHARCSGAQTDPSRAAASAPVVPVEGLSPPGQEASRSFRPVRDRGVIGENGYRYLENAWAPMRQNPGQARSSERWI